MFYRSTYIEINDDKELNAIGNWTKLQVSSYVTPSGRQLITLRHGEFDCINKIPCDYFYASVVALCVPSFFMLLLSICIACFFCFEFGPSYCLLLPIAIVIPPLLPLFKIGGMYLLIFRPVHCGYGWDHEDVD